MATAILATAYYWNRDRRREEAIKAFSTAFSFDSKPTWKSHLPPSASDIHEWSWADGFLPDYSYQLKARITEAEFQAFVSDLGLTPHTPDRRYSEDLRLSWGPAVDFEGNWWDPGDALDSTYAAGGHNTWTYAKFEKGFLYFKSMNH